MAKKQKLAAEFHGASGPLEAPSRARLIWLLDFLNRDLSKQTAGQRLDLQMEISENLWPDAYHGAETHLVEETAVWLHRELHAGMANLTNDRGWDLALPITRTVERLAVQTHLGGWILPVYARLGIKEGMLSAAIDLLLEFWPDLRQCEQCKAWFLPRHGRQRFHSDKCSFQSRWARFETSRKRDYHAEYKTRVKRAAPGAKPKKRVRK